MKRDDTKKVLDALLKVDSNLNRPSAWYEDARAAIAICEASLSRVAEPAAPIKRYEPERYDEDRVRMELDSNGDWVRYSDYLAACATPQEAAAQPSHAPVSTKDFTEQYREDARASIQSGGWAEAIRKCLPVAECFVGSDGEVMNPAPLSTLIAGDDRKIAPLYVASAIQALAALVIWGL